MLDRLTQLEPVILFATNTVIYNGRAHDTLNKLKEVVSQLNTLKAVVVFQNVEDRPTPVEELEEVTTGTRLFSYANFLQEAEDKHRPLIFEQLDADHPVYILFSSGTTGSMSLYNYKCRRRGD